MLRIIFSLFLLVGCSSQSEPHLTLLLDWLPNPNHVPLYVGQELGYFGDLEILKSTDNTSGLGHLAFGKIDLVVTYMPSFVKAEMHGAKNKCIAILIEKPLNSLLFYQDGTIHEPKDLSGKRFGFAHDSASSKLRTLLLNHEITPSSMQHSSFDLVGMLLTRQVDVVYGAYYTIEGEQIKSLDVPIGHFTVDELGFPPYAELIIAAREVQPEFTKALQRSIDYCVSHPEEAFNIYAARFPEKSQETLAWEKKAWEKTLPLLAKDQTIDPNMFTTLKDWFLKH